MNKTNSMDQLQSKYYEVFDTVIGKEVLEDIMASGLIHRASGDCEFVIMAREDGKRELALHIKNMAKKRDPIKKTEVIT